MSHPQPSASPQPPTGPQPADNSRMVTQRGALVVLLAVISGAAIGLLTVLAGQDVAEAVIAGLGATGAAICLYDRIIDR